MPRLIVSSTFVWSDYPGLRMGRLWAGKPDLTRHPTGEVHLASGPEAAQTLCGLDRSGFPHHFPEPTALGKFADPCATCRPADGV